MKLDLALMIFVNSLGSFVSKNILDVLNIFLLVTDVSCKTFFPLKEVIAEFCFSVVLFLNGALKHVSFHFGFC